MKTTLFHIALSAGVILGSAAVADPPKPAKSVGSFTLKPVPRETVTATAKILVLRAQRAEGKAGSLEATIRFVPVLDGQLQRLGKNVFVHTAGFPGPHSEHARIAVVRLALGDTKPTPKARKYWLGIKLAEIPESVRAHVDGVKQGGAMIKAVHPKSPAAMVGLRMHDLIAKVNHMPVPNALGASKLFADAGRKQVTIEFYRGGQKQTATLRSVERPKQSDPATMRDAVERALKGRIEGALKVGEGGCVQIIGPGFVVNPQAVNRLQIALPGIFKPGGTPAEIHQPIPRPMKKIGPSVREKEMGKRLQRLEDQYRRLEKLLQQLLESKQKKPLKKIGDLGAGRLITLG